MRNEAKSPGSKELLNRAIKNATPPPGREDYPRWACVRDLFEVDHKMALQLCREAGVNPYEYLDRPVCDVCPIDDWEDA